MLDWFNTIAGWLTNAQVRAILVALVIAWNVTQLAKNAPGIANRPERVRRWLVRAFAFIAGFIPAALLWPGPNAERATYAAAVGLAAPAAYKIAAAVLYHFFPWLEPKMSGRPTPTLPDEPPAEQLP